MIFDSFDSPELLDIQRTGFYHFLNQGIPQLLAKEFPIKVKNGSHSLELCLDEKNVKVIAPEDDPRDCILKMKSYSCKLYAQVKIVCKRSSSSRDPFFGNKEKIVYQSLPEWVLLGQLPIMTKRGHFIINGSPRVIVHQVVRAPGIYFQKLIKKDDHNRARFYGDIIPLKGVWVRLQMTKKGRVEAKFKKGKKVEVELLQRCLQVIENQTFSKSIYSFALNTFAYKSSYKAIGPGACKRHMQILATKRPGALCRQDLHFDKAKKLGRAFLEKDPRFLLYDEYSKLLDKKKSRAESKAEHDAFIHTYDKLYRTTQDKELEEWQNKKKNQNFFKASFSFGNSLAKGLRKSKYKDKAPHTNQRFVRKNLCDRSFAYVFDKAKGDRFVLQGNKALLKPLSSDDCSGSKGLYCRGFRKKNKVCKGGELGAPSLKLRKKGKNSTFTRAELCSKSSRKGDRGPWAPLQEGRFGSSSFLEKAFKRKKCSENLFATFKLQSRYDLGLLGREKINNKFGLREETLHSTPLPQRADLLGSHFAFGKGCQSEAQRIPPNKRALLMPSAKQASFALVRVPTSLPPEFVQKTNPSAFSRITQNNVLNDNANTQLTALDLCSATLWLYKLRKGEQSTDDIDHSQNRRVKTSGELLQTQFENGVYRLKGLLSTKLQEWRGDLNSSVFSSIFRCSCKTRYNSKNPFLLMTKSPKGSKKAELSYLEKKYFRALFSRYQNPSFALHAYCRGSRAHRTKTEIVAQAKSRLKPNARFVRFRYAKPRFVYKYKASQTNLLAKLSNKSKICKKATSFALVRKKLCPRELGKGKLYLTKRFVRSQLSSKVKKKAWTGGKTKQFGSRHESQNKAVHPSYLIKNQGNEVSYKLFVKELFSTKPITGALREFFGSNPLSQYMDQTNPLAEITHKRRISSLGIGGINRESAGMAIRGIHPTHYGRICPIETPEGKNAGLVNSLAFYTKVDQNGFLKTPYYRVFKGQIQSSLGFSFCSAKEELLTGLQIAPSDLQKSSNNVLRTRVSTLESVPVRVADNLLDVFKKENPYKVQLIAISPIQMISVATSLIPFLEHNDANRALMGSNMQRQAVPLMISERPIVGTGLESTVIVESGHITESQRSGFVSHVTANKVIVDSLFYQQKESCSCLPYYSLCKTTGTSPFFELKKRNGEGGKLKVVHLLPKRVKTLPNLHTGYDQSFVFSGSRSFENVSKHTAELQNKVLPTTAFGKNRSLGFAAQKQVLHSYKHKAFYKGLEVQSLCKSSYKAYANLRVRQKSSSAHANLLVRTSARGPLSSYKKICTCTQEDLYVRNSNVFSRFCKTRWSFFKSKKASRKGQRFVYRASQDRQDSLKNTVKFRGNKAGLCKTSTTLVRRFVRNICKYRQSQAGSTSLQESLIRRFFKKESQNQKQSFLVSTVSHLTLFSRSNQNTCITEKPLIREFDWVQKGDILSDCSASHNGELAVGKNVLLAYIPWEGYNFEDAIVISERLVKEHVYTSLHIERYVFQAQDLKDGHEWFTKHLPGVDRRSIQHLEESGLPKIGSFLREGDIIVGKIRYLNKKPSSPYERLLCDILGEKNFAARNKSLYVPKGVEARVIYHKVISLFDNDPENKVRPIKSAKTVHLFLGEKRVIQVGDKISGRHGNKGVISTILPRQDMPYLPDGTPIDIILNPLGVPSRMNVGQVLECLLGLAATYLNQHFKIAAFDERYGVEASKGIVFLKLYQARLLSGQNWLFQLAFPGKTRLVDGRSGECFDQWITVGRAYILKLIHMVSEKIHARSTGPYALITQQPLRGRSNKGGQRLGEMEVWALEGFGAAYTLQELLTKKSDDFFGRKQIVDSILPNPASVIDTLKPSNRIYQNKNILGHPEIFKVLLCELQALCLDLGVYIVTPDSFQRGFLGVVH